MIEFFVWLFMVCVVPFIFAMLELRFKEANPDYSHPFMQSEI